MKKFTSSLMHWYAQNQRDLPWRRSRDPYVIWVSEVILQQTRIDRGTPYFFRFLEAFPTVKDLAEASERDVLTLWQGLGYYSRARNMHQTAKMVWNDLHGNFPQTYEGLLKLKGVGPYTAAAIASIAFELPVALVDGNVVRFFSRFFGIQEPADSPLTKKEVSRLAQHYMDPLQPGAYNQAIMEMGAILCKPVNPSCNACPFREECFAYTKGVVNKLPSPKKRPIKRSRYIHYLVALITEPNQEPLILLHKRSNEDIWQGLYDFPSIETEEPTTIEKLVHTKDWRNLMGDKPTVIKRLISYKHVLSHQIIHAQFYKISSPPMVLDGFTWIPFTQLGRTPLPRLIDRFLSSNPL